MYVHVHENWILLLKKRAIAPKFHALMDGPERVWYMRLAACLVIAQCGYAEL